MGSRMQDGPGHMPGSHEPFFGRDSYIVPGRGTYAFHPVGNQNHVTGFDVLFHPEGGMPRSKGYGRMRVVVADDMAWGVEYVGTTQLDEAVVREASGPAREWLESHSVELHSALRGAVGIERGWAAKRRVDLENELSLREAILRRDPERPSAVDRAETARKDLESFEEDAAGRERVLSAVSDVLDAHRPSRSGEQGLLPGKLADAREEFLAPTGPTP